MIKKRERKMLTRMLSIDALIRDKRCTCLVCMSSLSSPHVLPRPEQRGRKRSLDRRKLIANQTGRDGVEC